MQNKIAPDTNQSHAPISPKESSVQKSKALPRHSSLVLVVVSFMVVSALQFLSVFTPSNRWLYDHASQLAYQWHWAKQAEQVGVYHKRPVLIAIDEPSLQSLGRWPWARQVHAQLLDVLQRSPTPPSVVAWDVVFSEPQALSQTNVPISPAALAPSSIKRIEDGDAQFARAITHSAFPIVLASQLEEHAQQLRLIAPRQPLSSSAARLAHVHTDTDADGSVRRYWPSDSRLNGLVLPYLGTALHAPNRAVAIDQIQSLSQNQNQNQNQRQSTSSALSSKIPTNTPTSAPVVDQSVWLYPMPRSWTRLISYQNVLSGLVSSDDWAGVPVLIAATAKGLGDQYVSALYEPSGVVAGGELVLGALHTEMLLAAGLAKLGAAPWYGQLLGTFLSIAAVLYGLRRSKQWGAQVLILLAGLAFIALSSLAILVFAGIWVNAAQCLFAVLLSWMLWMSYTVRRFIAHVQVRIKQLSHAPAAFKSRHALEQTQLAQQAKPLAKVGADLIDAQLSAVQTMEQQQQADFSRLAQVLNVLPDAAFVLGQNALEPRWAVQLHNQIAQQLCVQFAALKTGVNTEAESLTALLDALLGDFTPDLTQQQQAFLLTVPRVGYGRLDASVHSLPTKEKTIFHWQDLLVHHEQAVFAQGVEADSQGGARFLIKVATINDNASLNAPLGSGERNDEAQREDQREVQWTGNLIVSVVDLSVGRALAASREQTLNFLSHDLRAPQASIVALLELEKVNHPELAPLFKKINFQAQLTLQLAEGFVQWSQASHRPTYQFMEYDLNELMIEALDEQWASAKRKGVLLDGQALGDALWVRLDRSLMWRALINLIGNALNACSAGQQVCLSTWQAGSYAVVAVQDNGPGIPESAQANLFEPFTQGAGLKRTGAGLGLAFVKTVLQQHQGLVKLNSPTHPATPARVMAHGTRFELWLPLHEGISISVA